MCTGMAEDYKCADKSTVDGVDVSRDIWRVGQYPLIV